jgi:hypothetical protein
MWERTTSAIGVFSFFCHDVGINSCGTELLSFDIGSSIKSKSNLAVSIVDAVSGAFFT